jgi:hypothetical protein
MQKFTLNLQHHPITPVTWIQQVTVDCAIDNKGMALTYQILGNMQQLQLPVCNRAPIRADNLWLHTCCELFIAPIDSTHYQEWNFAPTGDWQLYEFSSYRTNRTTPETLAPHINYLLTAKQFTLNTQISPSWRFHNMPESRLGVSLVIQDVNNKICYWALKHFVTTPDFHWDGSWDKKI